MSPSPWLDPALPVDRLTPPQVAICTVYGEARSEPPEGIIAVAHVLAHRVAAGRFGSDLRAVCLQPFQFSCWNPVGGERNYQRVADLVRLLASGAPVTDPVVRQVAYLVHGVVDGYVRDTVKGATHYHTAALTPRPAWARDQVPVKQAGAHVFYAGVR